VTAPTARRVPLIDLAADHREIEAELRDVWSRVVASGHFVGGPVVDAFEDAFAGLCGRRSCVGVANGTDALELILAGLGIGPGDEVIVPANGFVATPEAVVRSGATPVFADVEAATGLVTADTVAAAITAATAAVIVVHLYGQMPDMDGLLALAEARSILLIEDAAQAHGAAWDGRPAGSFGAAAAFSFYPTKNLGAFGDGGAVVTDDPALAARVRTLTNHGRRAGSHHRHDIVGRNSRLDALQAGVLSVKLRHLERWNGCRRVASARYRTQLRGTGCTSFVVRQAATPVHYLEVLLVPDRDAVFTSLEAHGIECGLHYPVPCHRQPPFERFARHPLPVTEELAGQVLSVPMHPSLSAADVDVVCEALADAVSDDGGPLATAAAS
jgi:dTDP-4-amino-4,6-dideoxygalactose transaminase